MDEKVHKKLTEADDPVHWEMPPTFAWKTEIARVKSRKSSLEAVVGHALELNENIQDAAHFAELAWLTGPDEHKARPHQEILSYVAIRFSAFGRFATIWGNVAELPISDSLLLKLTDALTDAGYVPIPIADLNERYDGGNQYAESIETWWYRYFDYCRS